MIVFVALFVAGVVAGWFTCAVLSIDNSRGELTPPPAPPALRVLPARPGPYDWSSDGPS